MHLRSTTLQYTQMQKLKQKTLNSDQRLIAHNVHRQNTNILTADGNEQQPTQQSDNKQLKADENAHLG